MEKPMKTNLTRPNSAIVECLRIAAARGRAVREQKAETARGMLAVSKEGAPADNGGARASDDKINPDAPKVNDKNAGRESDPC